MKSADTFNQLDTEAPYPIRTYSRTYGIYLVLDVSQEEVPDEILQFTVEATSQDLRYKNYFKGNRFVQPYQNRARIVFTYDHGDGIKAGDKIFVLRDGEGNIVWVTPTL